MTEKTASYTVLERGWLSSNNIVFSTGEQTTVVDTGYCTHADQTLVLIQAALRGRSLNHIVNTHLHSDHCGGNAALQSYYPQCFTHIPPGSSKPVAVWDEQALSYLPTGQSCPRFGFQKLLAIGQTIQLGDSHWEIHAAPGHDPDSVILFEPASRTLISADALWENGFGVVFQELEGQNAFDQVAVTLDLIERLSPVQIIPGHGSVFHELAPALQRARSRLDSFVREPIRHARYGAKVLVKYKMLELQQCDQADLRAWMDQTPYFVTLQRNFFSTTPLQQWFDELVADLVRSQALNLLGTQLINLD